MDSVQASLRFPLFALRDAPNEGLVVVLKSPTNPGVLVLFSDAEWAADFARRLDLPMVPSIPLFPEDICELITSFKNKPTHIALDPVDVKAAAEMRQFPVPQFLERFSDRAA